MYVWGLDEPGLGLFSTAHQAPARLLQVPHCPSLHCPSYSYATYLISSLVFLLQPASTLPLLTVRLVPARSPAPLVSFLKTAKEPALIVDAY